MPSVAGADSVRMARSDLYKAVARSCKPRTRTAIGQVLETFLPYFTLWALMIITVRAGLAYGITLALAVITGHAIAYQPAIGDSGGEDLPRVDGHLLTQVLDQRDQESDIIDALGVGSIGREAAAVIPMVLDPIRADQHKAVLVGDRHQPASHGAHVLARSPAAVERQHERCRCARIQTGRHVQPVGPLQAGMLKGSRLQRFARGRGRTR